MRVVKYWSRLPREAVGTPSLEILTLDDTRPRAPCCTGLGMSKRWDWGPLQGPSLPTYAMLQLSHMSFCFVAVMMYPFFTTKIYYNSEPFTRLCNTVTHADYIILSILTAICISYSTSALGNRAVAGHALSPSPAATFGPQPDPKLS